MNVKWPGPFWGVLLIAGGGLALVRQMGIWINSMTVPGHGYSD